MQGTEESTDSARYVRGSENDFLTPMRRGQKNERTKDRMNMEYISKLEIGPEGRLLTIKKIFLNTPREDGWLISFDEILNVLKVQNHHIDEIEESLGSGEIEALAGKQVILYDAGDLNFAGKPVPVFKFRAVNKN